MLVKDIILKNIVWREGKQYVAQCLNVDVSSFGTTKAEAVKNLQEALELRFEDEVATHVNEVESPEVIETRVKFA